MYGYGLLSRGITNQREILHGGRPHLVQVFSYFGDTAPGMAKFWVSTGAIWRDMLLAEALVTMLFIPFLHQQSLELTQQNSATLGSEPHLTMYVQNLGCFSSKSWGPESTFLDVF